MSEQWEAALLLVENLTDNELRVVPETVEKLCNITDPVRCIAFVGPYRIGKSHLANLLVSMIFKKDNVFTVGNTVESKTKGLWIWCTRHPEEPNSWIIFMDTEGLSDVHKGDNHNDTQNFILSLLLSSVFVYNSRGAIDYQAIESLHYVSQIAQNIRLHISSADDDEDEEELGYDLIFPNFVWVVRDFHLQKMIDGEEKTDDEYLECALRTKKDVSKASQLSVKRCVKEYFPSRRCFTLPPLGKQAAASGAAGSMKILQKMVDYLLGSPPKIYEGHKITGQVLGRLVETYVSVLPEISDESKLRICVEEVVTKVKDMENKKVVKKCVEMYKAAMDRKSRGILDESELCNLHMEALGDATTAYFASAVKPVDSHYPELTSLMKEEFETLCEAKKKQASVECDKVWHRLKAEVMEDMKQYIVQGGFRRFQDTSMELRRRCNTEDIFKGRQGNSYLSTKLAELIETEGQMILQSDQTLSELAKQQEVTTSKKKREADEEKLSAAADKEAEEYRRKAESYEEFVTTRVKNDFDEKAKAETDLLRERIRQLEMEKENLKVNGLSEEVENRQERQEKYQIMLRSKEAKNTTEWEDIGRALGNVAGYATDVLVSEVLPKALALVFRQIS